MDEVSLWNNNQQWTPVSIDGSVLVFSLQSNGEFVIYDNGRKILFSFFNDMQQAFTIDKTFSPNAVDSKFPGDVTSDSTYRQTDSWNHSANTNIWVKSKGTPIRALSVRGVNCLPAKLGSIDESLGMDYLKIYVQMDTSVVGSPASLYVGDVLVWYISNVT